MSDLLKGYPEMPENLEKDWEALELPFLVKVSQNKKKDLIEKKFGMRKY